jgi:HEPN domain-containing protein
MTAGKQNKANNWRDLASRAREYHLGADLLFDQNLFQNSLEQAHLSVELIFKAAIHKAGGISMQVHDLRNLSETRVNGRRFLSKEITAQKNTRTEFNKIISAWNMQMRYEKLDWDFSEVEELLESYRKVYSWTKINYVE